MRDAEARVLLAVSAHASQDEIRRAYRRAALRWHPDKNPGDTEAATMRFRQVHAAYLALQGPNEGTHCEGRKENDVRKEQMPTFEDSLRAFHSVFGAAAKQTGKAVLGATEKVLDAVSTPGRLALDAAGGAASERASRLAAVRREECEVAREAAAEQAARIALYEEQAAYCATVVLEQRRRLLAAEQAYDEVLARQARRERVRVRDETVYLRRQRMQVLCVGLPTWLAVAECLPSLAVSRLGGAEYLPSWLRIAA